MRRIALLGGAVAAVLLGCATPALAQEPAAAVHAAPGTPVPALLGGFGLVVAGSGAVLVHRRRTPAR
ncbi:MAG: hypothetical protein QOE45_1325 [Frankiaceae bacterium]|jgi:hypothetical protein|nr:hypothetical protein [Frankiaceae bacterium]